MSTTNSNAYLRTKVLTASPAELRLMLFDGAIKFAQQAAQGLKEEDYEKAFNGFTRAQDIVMELINSLRPERDHELCEKLTALYTFIYGRLVTASTQRDVSVAEEAIALLRYERETWGMVIERLASENANANGMQSTPRQDANANAANQPPSGLIGGKVSLRG